ncbi:MAG TPA: hypothetical protein VHA82_07660 [Ramlibacter sp.]|uniref:hypothetical protein n=1 Tax=Ramlibacter sp. TaxID=1917967 RepID=UPI002C03FFE8|nr:hypothetical protein [Ramlibacter sp.]HVZ43672.1 hypothetical protein [Ramlibacter sp.]
MKSGLALVERRVADPLLEGVSDSQGSLLPQSSSVPLSLLPFRPERGVVGAMLGLAGLAMVGVTAAVSLLLGDLLGPLLCALGRMKLSRRDNEGELPGKASVFDPPPLRELPPVRESPPDRWPFVNEPSLDEGGVSAAAGMSCED